MSCLAIDLAAYAKSSFLSEERVKLGTSNLDTTNDLFTPKGRCQGRVAVFLYFGIFSLHLYPGDATCNLFKFRTQIDNTIQRMTNCLQKGRVQ